MSAIEARHQDISHQDYLPFTFKDKNNESFRAKADALLVTPVERIYIELKEHPLNSITSRKVSRNRLLEQYRYRFHSEAPNAGLASKALHYNGHNKDCLDFGWNHSGYKHQEVNRVLSEQGIKYIVVFSNHPPDIEWYGKQTPFKRFYKQRYGLETMLESEFNQLKESLIVH